MNNNTCPTCGSKVNIGENFCRTCGSKLPTNNNQNFNQQNTNSDSINQNFNQQNSNGMNETNHQDNNQNSSYNSDEDLVRAYIGPNADEMLKENFSFCSFFWGALYAFYRKMWILGSLWILANVILIMILRTLSSILVFGITIFMAITFKKYYIKHVREEVDKIKKENPGKSQNELIEICNKKGGTTIIPIIIMVVIWIIIIIVSYFTLQSYIQDLLNRYGSDSNYSDYSENSEDSQTGNGLIKDLDVIIPKDFKESSYSSNTLKMYHLSTNDSLCDLNIKYRKNYLNNKDSKQFLEEEIYYNASDTYSGISSKKINNETWDYATVTDKNGIIKYYYGTLKDNNFYLIDFHILDDEGKLCSKAYNTVINSLKFK